MQKQYRSIFSLACVTLTLALSACNSSTTVPAVTSVFPTETTSNKQTYLVVLKAGNGLTAQSVQSQAVDRVAALGGIVKQNLSAIDILVVELTPAAATTLSQESSVSTVEPEKEIILPPSETEPDPSPNGTQQGTPSWGLDRIDQRTGENGTYTYNDKTTGGGVTAYVIDSGISVAHPDFGGRATLVANFINDGIDDCNGHGTHVAGTIGGTRYGVAKNVTLKGLKVFGCDARGTTTNIISAIDWVVRNKTGPSVINMSLSSSGSNAVDSAVARATDAGIVVVVAAANNNTDACLSSPARAGSAITVAATNRSDGRATPTDWGNNFGSNFGNCVDIFAPGTGITSTWLNNGTATLNGTSMATPHVAGVVATYLDNHTNASVSQVTEALIRNSTKDIITNVSSSPNRFLYSVFPSVALPTPGCGNLQPGEALRSGESKAACNNGVTLTYQGDGNLVLTRTYDSRPLWASGTSGTSAGQAVMQTDGNLVIYDAANVPIWSSNTFGNLGSFAAIQDDGNFVIYNDAPVWSSDTFICGRLLTNEKLLPGGSTLNSCNGAYFLSYQSDGNLVLYRTSDNQAVWASETYGATTGRTVLLPGGDLVVYNALNSPVWRSKTPQAASDAVFDVLNTGELRISSGKTVLWSVQPK